MWRILSPTPTIKSFCDVLIETQTLKYHWSKPFLPKKYSKYPVPYFLSAFHGKSMVKEEVLQWIMFPAFFWLLQVAEKMIFFLALNSSSLWRHNFSLFLPAERRSKNGESCSCCWGGGLVWGQGQNSFASSSFISHLPPRVSFGIGSPASSLFNQSLQLYKFTLGWDPLLLPKLPTNPFPSAL